KVKAGEQLVFENGAAMLRSALQPVFGIYDADQNPVAQYGLDGGRAAEYFAHHFEKAGSYYLRISDYEEQGGPQRFYRIKVGKFPLVLSAYPLGVERGKTAEVSLAGFNLETKMAVSGEPSPEDERAVIVRPKARGGRAFNKVKLAVDSEPA